jgi:virginiamycin A acetyltransferase
MANIIDESAVISKLASIDVSSRGTNTIIGAKCVIDDFVKIKHVGGTGDIVLGDFVYLNSGTVIYSGNGVNIGNNVLIGPNCSIVPVNHNFENKEIPIRLQGFQASRGGIIIEEDVWLGANVTIVDGAVIKKGAIIGANSIVIGQIEAYSVCFGNPAKKIKSR